MIKISRILVNCPRHSTVVTTANKKLNLMGLMNGNKDNTCIYLPHVVSNRQ